MVAGICAPAFPNGTHGESICVNRTDFQELADVRIGEAEVLVAQGKWDGAYYLAGYAVECALKACIAKLTNLHDFPPKSLSENRQGLSPFCAVRRAKWGLSLSPRRFSDRL
jgi:hypothetical protein